MLEELFEDKTPWHVNMFGIGLKHELSETGCNGDSILHEKTQLDSFLFKKGPGFTSSLLHEVGCGKLEENGTACDRPNLVVPLVKRDQPAAQEPVPGFSENQSIPNFLDNKGEIAEALVSCSTVRISSPVQPNTSGAEPFAILIPAHRRAARLTGAPKGRWGGSSGTAGPWAG